jgi:sugar O-acyltransferase (sialic acid O-acetyltransferase NeuD family)
MKKSLLIYGAGGLGREILSLVQAADQWEPRGFIDDAQAPGTQVNGLDVLGGISVLESFHDPTYVVLALGDPFAKQKLVSRLAGRLVQYPVLVHPRAIIQDEQRVRLEEGCVITAGCILTTDIRVGRHVLLNLNSTVGHDSVIGDYSSIMCGVNIAGNVQVGEGVLIGSGANVRNHTDLGDWVRVGMGAVVLRSVDAGKTVVGIPAREIADNHVYTPGGK